VCTTRRQSQQNGMDGVDDDVRVEITSGAPGDSIVAFRCSRSVLRDASQLFATMLDGAFAESKKVLDGKPLRVVIPPLEGAPLVIVQRACDLFRGSAQPAPCDIVLARTLDYVHCEVLLRELHASVGANLDLWSRDPFQQPVADASLLFLLYGLAYPESCADGVHDHPTEPLTTTMPRGRPAESAAAQVVADAGGPTPASDPHGGPLPASCDPRCVLFAAARVWARAGPRDDLCESAIQLNQLQQEAEQMVNYRGDALREYAVLERNHEMRVLGRMQAERVHQYARLGGQLLATWHANMAAISADTHTTPRAFPTAAFAWTFGGNCQLLAQVGARIMRDWAAPLFGVDYAWGTGLSIVDALALPRLPLELEDPMGEADIGLESVLVSNRASVNDALVHLYPRLGPLLVGGGGIFERFGRNVVLAGGAVIEAVQVAELRAPASTQRKRDLDLWVIGATEQERRAALDSVVHHAFAAMPDGFECKVSGSVVTFTALPFTVDDTIEERQEQEMNGQEPRESIQIIFTDMARPAQVVASFDLSHVGAYYDGTRVGMMAECLWALVSRTTRPLPGIKPRASRLRRAHAKGFAPPPHLLPDTLAPLQAGADAGDDPADRDTTRGVTMADDGIDAGDAQRPGVPDEPQGGEANGNHSKQEPLPQKVGFVVCTTPGGALAALDYAPMVRNVYEFCRSVTLAGTVPDPFDTQDDIDSGQDDAPIDKDDVDGNDRNTVDGEDAVPVGKEPEAEPNDDGEAVRTGSCHRCGVPTDQYDRHVLCGMPEPLREGHDWGEHRSFVLHRSIGMRLAPSMMMANPACGRCLRTPGMKRACKRQGPCAHLTRLVPPCGASVHVRRYYSYANAGRQLILSIAVPVASETQRDIDAGWRTLHDRMVSAGHVNVEPIDNTLSAGFERGRYRAHIYSYSGKEAREHNRSHPLMWPSHVIERAWNKLRRPHKRLRVRVNTLTSFLDGITGLPCDVRDHMMGSVVGGTVAIQTVVYDGVLTIPVVYGVTMRAYPPWFADATDAMWEGAGTDPHFIVAPASGTAVPTIDDFTVEHPATLSDAIVAQRAAWEEERQKRMREWNAHKQRFYGDALLDAQHDDDALNDDEALAEDKHDTIAHDKSPYGDSDDVPIENQYQCQDGEPDDDDESDDDDNVGIDGGGHSIVAHLASDDGDDDEDANVIRGGE